MESQWANVLHFYRQFEVATDIGVGLILLAIMFLCVDKLFTKEAGWLLAGPRRRGRMIRKARRQYVDQLATYDFVDKIEERIYQGAITRAEANELYRKMKQLFPIRNLFPSPELLKENIDKRLRKGTHAPVPLPDQSEAVPEVKKGAKFVKA
jgi:hypothetical protein